MKDFFNSLKISTALIKKLKTDESFICTVNMNESIGTPPHSLGRVVDFKIQTEECNIIRSLPLSISLMAIVSRIADPVTDIPLIKRLQISTARLRDMEEGQRCIFTERKTQSTGVHAQGIASRCKLHITTEKCFVFIPKTLQAFNAVIVTMLKGVK